MASSLHPQVGNINRIVLIGACAIDTILNVPHYPTEDSKLRAHSVTRRRGGNTANTAEVLHQLITSPTSSTSSSFTSTTASRTAAKPKLHLINVFPSRTSPAFKTIRESLDPSISTSYSIFRESHREAITSYIVSSAAADSRTCITHNELPEMTADEFKDAVEALVGDEAKAEGNGGRTWFHFEGRTPETTRACIKYLKDLQTNEGFRCCLSVEAENPGREGLEELGRLADVVFYSKDWALGWGYADAETCLIDQARRRADGPADCLVCTWGDQGSWALAASDQEIPPDQISERSEELVVVRSDACKVKKVVDSVGAGDTFIAAMLHTMTSSDWAEKSTMQKLRFANACAAKKISQEGFAKLLE